MKMMNVLNDIMRNVLVFMFTFTGALIPPSFSASVARRWLNYILNPAVEKSYVT